MATRIFLALIALTYTAFGIWSLMSPVQMAAQLGVDVSGPNGAFELRGVYGGISLGAAALCAAGAVLDRMARPALWFLTAYMGGYCFARPIAWLIGSAPTPEFYTYIAFEAAVLIVAVSLLLVRRGR